LRPSILIGPMPWHILHMGLGRPCLLLKYILTWYKLHKPSYPLKKNHKLRCTLTSLIDTCWFCRIFTLLILTIWNCSTFFSCKTCNVKRVYKRILLNWNIILYIMRKEETLKGIKNILRFALIKTKDIDSKINVR
jgi:hypothetical protein